MHVYSYNFSWSLPTFPCSLNLVFQTKFLKVKKNAIYTQNRIKCHIPLTLPTMRFHRVPMLHHKVFSKMKH